MNVVKVISTRIDSAKRRLIKFLRYGNEDVQECLEVSPYGIDSNPIKDMVAIYAPTGEIGQNVVVGYVNKNKLSKVGEFRVFSTDSDGVEQTFIYLKNNGDIHLGGDSDNAVRYSELKKGFDQLKSDFNSLVNTFNTHIHPTPSGPSSPTATPGTVSASSIDASKIDNVKTS